MSLVQPKSTRPIYLLCGGGSRRMGRDKAMLPFGGGTLLDHQIQKCGNAFSEIVLLSGARQYPVALRQLPDAMEDAGPLSGLLAALEDSAVHQSPSHSDNTIAVMAIDLPEVSPATLRLLASEKIPRQYNALISEPDVIGDDTRKQPLLGVYDRRIASHLRHYLEADHRSVLGFLAQIGTAAFKVPESELRNMNTEADYYKLKNKRILDRRSK